MPLSSTTNTTQKEALFLFLVTAASILALWKRQQRSDEDAPGKRKRRDFDALSRDDPSAVDSFHLEQAHIFRLDLVPPQQSNFRVVAIFLLEDGQTIYGTNDEPSPNISLSMCAERCALLKYRTLKCTELVKTIYIVTDADIPISPGTACREYMNGHPAITRDTRIVMQSSDHQSEPLIMPLSELHPFPSIYTGLDPQEQVKLGDSLQQSIRMDLEQLEAPGISQPTLMRLIKAARQACDMDDRDSLHSIRYGAAMAIETDKENGTVEVIRASQIKALEYSSTLDAVCQLASQVLSLTQKEGRHQQGGSRVLVVVQVDQFGIPHGPFAQARAFLVEHGFGDCRVILTATDGMRVQTMFARDLAPLVPAFRSM